MMDYQLKIGMKAEKTDIVTAANTAVKYGSGSVEVYATPAMIGLMEGAALACVDPHLPEGKATVGTALIVKHLAATPIGMNVRAVAHLSEISGKKLVFKVQVFDEKEMIGEGIHERYIIGLDNFINKAQDKLKK